jgi:hypothetical protein
MKFPLVLIAASVLVLTILFIATDPQSARLTGILMAVVFLYVLFWGIFLLGGNLLCKSRREKVVQKMSSKLKNGQRLRISAALAFAPVLVIVFNSLGNIGVVELVLIMSFEAIVIFLIRKKR